MGRKHKNFNEMSVANGKTWNEQEIDCAQKKYHKNNISLAEYTNQIKNMNKIDLDQHATSVYVLPRENRDNLIDQLIKEFKKKISYFI